MMTPAFPPQLLSLALPLKDGPSHGQANLESTTVARYADWLNRLGAS